MSESSFPAQLKRINQSQNVLLPTYTKAFHTAASPSMDHIVLIWQLFHSCFETHLANKEQQPFQIFSISYKKK